MTRILELLARLNRREKTLVALLGLAVIPLALVFLVALPALEARDSAARQNAEAQVLLAWTVARDAEWQRLAPTAASAVSTGPIGLSGLESALADAGLRDGVTALETASGGRVVLRMKDVPFVAAAGFLDTLGTTSGYEIGRLSLNAGDTPASVAVDVELLPAP